VIKEWDISIYINDALAIQIEFNEYM